MRLSDCWIYAMNDHDDLGWGCTYRTTQTMHWNLLGEEPPNTLKAITDLIPGKKAEAENWLEPLDAQTYFKAILASKKAPSPELKFFLYKHRIHGTWKKEIGNLERYWDLPESTLHEFLSEYFTEERGAANKCRIIMFDDGI